MSTFGFIELSMDAHCAFEMPEGPRHPGPYYAVRHINEKEPRGIICKECSKLITRLAAKKAEKK